MASGRRGSGTLTAYPVIGDVVGSRALPDRAAAQDALGDALATTNRELAAVQDLEPTVGDEFQGAFASLADAVLAGLLVRLRLLPAIDVRCGIGHGEVAVHDATRTPLLQDGPGWWAAREAVETLGSLRGPARTWYVARAGRADAPRARGRAGPAGEDRDEVDAYAGAVNAHLTCRDQLVARLSDRGCRMLRLSLLGSTQREIAESEQITASAVSQQFARGIGAVRDAQAMLTGAAAAADPGSAGTTAGR